MTRSLLVIAALLAAVFFGLQAVEVQQPPWARAPLGELPRSLGTWNAQTDYELDAQTVAVLRADDYVARHYSDSRVAIDLFVVYYRSQSNGEAIHSPMNCLPGFGWQPLERTRIAIDVDGGRPIQAQQHHRPEGSRATAGHLLVPEPRSNHRRRGTRRGRISCSIQSAWAEAMRLLFGPDRAARGRSTGCRGACA